jgi:hypothetical protein
MNKPYPEFHTPRCGGKCILFVSTLVLAAVVTHICVGSRAPDARQARMPAGTILLAANNTR